MKVLSSTLPVALPGVPVRRPAVFPFTPRAGLWAALAASAVLVACGGGGGVAATGPTLSGIAATGAALGEAAITVTSSDPNVAPYTQCPATNATTGEYSCTLPVPFPAPWVIKAEKTDGAGNSQQQFSVVASAATSGDTKANITPLTTAVVALLSPTGDPAGFAAEVQKDKTRASAEAVTKQVDTLQTNLQPLIDGTVGSGKSINPMTDTFTAGSSKGMDQLLDAVKVSTTSTVSGAPSQVSIVLKADPEAKVTLAKDSTSGEVTPATKSLDKAAVEAAKTTLESNPTALISDLLTRMNTCYALPLTSRVDKTDGTGTAANVAASECKKLFTQDDPSKFKSSGNTVGAIGAFANLFSDAATGVKFDQGNLEYVINNTETTDNNNTANHGLWVVSYRSTDKTGNVAYGNFAVKKEGSELKQAGNQYAYNTGVSAYAQSRHFVNQPASDYLSTGFVVTVKNKVGSNGNSIFKQVEVTTPTGETLTLKPVAGCSNLGLVVSATKTMCSTFVRLRSEYIDTSKTSLTMPSVDTANLFFVGTPKTDKQLAELPALNPWNFKITLVDGSVVTQKHKSMARPPTIAELRKQAFVEMASAAEADVKSATASSGYYMFSKTDTNATVSLGDLSKTPPTAGWTVPTGALAPTTFNAYGFSPSGRVFSDAVTVLPTARAGEIKCSRETTVDDHCNSTVTVGSTGFYAAGTKITEVNLNADSAKGVTFGKTFAVYYPEVITGSLASFAGTYQIKATETINGVAQSESGGEGTVTLSYNGTISNCTVGVLRACSGQATLDKSGGVTFTLTGNDGLNPVVFTASLTGTVTAAGQVTGSLTFNEVGGKSDGKGIFTGQKI